MSTPTNTDILLGLYRAFFLRAPDQEGYVDWITKLNQDVVTKSEVAAGFLAHPYAQINLKYGTLSDEKFVEAIYANLLNGTGDTAPTQQEIDYWVGNLAGGQTRSDMVLQFVTNSLSLEFDDPESPGALRQQAILNSNAVASTYMSALREDTAISAVAKADPYQLALDPAFLASQRIIEGVTSDPNTATNAQNFLQSTAAPSADPISTINDASDQEIFGTGGGGDGQNFTLTTGQDLINGGAGSDFIRGVAGSDEGSQDQTTLNSSDIIDGKDGEDTLIVNMTGLQYQGGATIKNVEVLQIGTNQAVENIRFDLNVNQGAYEVTGANVLLYDQITHGETLSVLNVVPVAVDENPVPTLRWGNEANSRAGTIATTYREETITGSNNQRVELVNVDATQGQGTADGTLLIAGGMETITITSAGTVAQNTLNNVQEGEGSVVANGVVYADTASNGINNTRADIISRGSLTQVVLLDEGDAETEVAGVAIGRAAGVQTDSSLDNSFGMTDRFWTLSRVDDVDGDLGLTTKSSASNLLSVGARVTEIDASAMTAAANVRFTAKTDAPTDVTFKGGAAGDYVEFELGNVTANGNDGDDTFSFITQANGVTNSTYGAGDTIDGGAGSDTLQLSVNATGRYSLSVTEFQNTTGIDVLDLRGNNNMVTIAASLVDGADADKFAVHTDRIIQTANDNALNPTTDGVKNGLEDASVHTVYLTDLGGDQGIDYLGGSGSDRLVLDDVAFNQAMALNGGTAETGKGLVAGDYDTLTVLDNAVIDRTDLANTKNFEGLVLVETGTGNSQFSLEITEAFLRGNASGSDLTPTSTLIDDKVFQIGTIAAANGNALEGGDVVTIDVTDLYEDGKVKTSLGSREIDTTSLTRAGVTVQYVYDGQTYDLAALPDDMVKILDGNDLNRGHVLQSAANVTENQGIVYYSGVGPQRVVGTDSNDIFHLSQGDTVAGGDGVDTVNFNPGSEQAIVTLGAGADTVNLGVALDGGGGGSLVMTAGGTVNVAVDLGDMNAFPGTYDFRDDTTLNVSVFQTRLDIENGAHVTTQASGGGTFFLGNGGQLFTGTSTVDGAEVYTIGDNVGNDTIVAGGNDDTILISIGNDRVDAGAGDDQVYAFLDNGSTQESTLVLGAGKDSLLLDNDAIDKTTVEDKTTVRVTDFEIGNDTVSTGIADSGFVPGSFNSANAGDAKATGLVSGDVIEILSTGAGGDGIQIGTPTSDGSLLSSLNKVLTNNGTIADIADGLYTVIGYQSDNAYLYHLQIAGSNGTAGSDDFVELIGILENVGADNINSNDIIG